MIVKYEDLRVILRSQFFDVGETNNWVLRLKNLLMQSDWNLKVGYTPCMRIFRFGEAMENNFF